jgi:leucyl-tRNA synthetase
MSYDAREVEQRWQRRWRDKKIFQAPVHSSKPKFYCLEMLPYPSGETALAAVYSNPALQRHIKGKQIVRIVFVPDELINLVVKP